MCPDYIKQADKTKSMLRIAIYLRKSRADEEAERELGKGETLARHRKALLRFAKEKNLNIVRIFEELVSGEELFFRPKMLELLKEVEQGLYDAVLVMDVYRLGRGDQEEQGLILKAFKKSRTKIITPNKTFDLDNEFDEDYLEFEGFMSRKQYKVINKGMQGGRIRSVQEGNYIATRPPYGYLIEDLGKKGRILIPHPDQADVVKMIFNWYVNKHMGFAKIADGLNRLGIKSYTGGLWERTSLSSLLKNQVYIGKLVWKKKCIRKSKTPGKKKDAYTRDKSDWIIADGKHQAIIDVETFNKAQEILQGKYHVPYQIENGMVNPLAGLVVCGICGAKMKRRPYADKEAHLICEKKCGIKSNKFVSVESSVLSMLSEYMNDLELKSKTMDTNDATHEIRALNANLTSLENEIDVLQKQRLKLHDLLEQGVYSVEVFVERNNIIADKIEAAEKAIKTTNAALAAKNENSKSIEEFLNEVRYVVEMYDRVDDVEKKNALLKSVLDKIIYVKEKTWKSDNFQIRLSPKYFDITAS